jgi:hypothetical protein
MDTRDEMRRIASNNDLTSMPAIPWEFDVVLGPNPENTLSLMLNLLHEIAKYDFNSWPSDDHWQATLPDWMKSHLPELTKEDMDRLLANTPHDQWNTLPWDFGSWLDAVRDRGWRWWGYKRDGSSATLVLHIGMFPERTDSFRLILRASGMNIVRERYSGLNPT